MQLDIYGEMLDSFFHAQHGMRRHTEDDFRVLVLLLEHLETIWQNPDHGIWEMRGDAPAFHVFQNDGLGGLRPRACCWPNN